MDIGKLPLTKKQKKILKFIKHFYFWHRYYPTIKEIKTKFRLSSFSGTWQHLKALEKKGWIERKKHYRRWIQIK